jgi:hypothetical protein
MEDYDYELLGKFDLVLLLCVIYHIGKTEDYQHLNAEQITHLQVETLRKIASVSRYQLFQGNPLVDEGRGKGRDSLLALVKQAGLKVVKETKYDHPRGYILLTKSETFKTKENFPIHRMINKYFLPACQSAEREMVNFYIQNGRNQFEVSETRYYRLRTGQADWNTPGMSHMPKSLTKTPYYWIVPWSYKLRNVTPAHIRVRTKIFPQIITQFYDLINSMISHGFDANQGIIPGYKLVHPEYGEVFLYTDGNHRMGVFSYISEQNNDSDFVIPVEVRQEIHREKLLDYPLTQQLIDEGYFSSDDVYKWFDNAFWFLSGSKKKLSVKKQVNEYKISQNSSK